MKHWFIPAICLTLLSAAAYAQLGLPTSGLPRVGLPELPVELPQTSAALAQLGRTLETARLDRLPRFVRQNREAVDYDSNRYPAVRGELVATGLSDDAIKAAQSAGFSLLSRDAIDGLDLNYVRFATPAKMSLADAEKKLRALLPNAEIDANPI